ncbi:DoxX family protein [Niabella beijingensis]|uniref:DoxX family protein n=1 Tax=Niabella beijingensis TaxID=2872700 RepID=UPI001CBFBBAE|nr:DoxX family protein [Niabella beijingensis]MBZ4189242.1 DoxX family protein [Niabella beijingensis]
MKIVKQILFTLFALVFIIFGLNKFFNYMPPPKLTPEQMEVVGAFMKLKWLMPLLGTMETVGGLLVILPKTRALGALILFPIMVGIVLHHGTMEPSGLPMALLLAVILIWIIIDNRKKYELILK